VGEQLLKFIGGANEHDAGSGFVSRGTLGGPVGDYPGAAVGGGGRKLNVFLSGLFLLPRAGRFFLGVCLSLGGGRGGRRGWFLQGISPIYRLWGLAFHTGTAANRRFNSSISRPTCSLWPGT
jgi:hypothetical protein